MADRWVALLRAVNLGSRNRVPMAELRVLLEESGYADVATYIQSGNVLFAKRASDRAALARKLERTIEDAFGVRSPVVLRTGPELRKVARSHPFGSDTSKTHVAFLAAKPAAEAARRLKAEDDAVLKGSDVYLHYPEGVQGARRTGALLERQLGVPATIRNWKTMTRLAELAEAPYY